MTAPKFHIFQNDNDSLYNYKLTDAEGNIILLGVGYSLKEICQEEIDAVQVNCPINSRYLKRSAIMSYSFYLTTWTGDKLGKSPDFTSGIEMESAISKVKMYAPVALIEDLCEVAF